MSRNKRTVHEWLLTMPETLATEAVSLTPPSMLREDASCLSHALMKAFVWKEEKWLKIYYANMPNFMSLVIEYRDYLNISGIARAMNVKRQRMEILLADEDKHTPELNEKLLHLFSGIAIDINTISDREYTCPESQGQGR
jgi:hypothetical protein